MATTAASPERWIVKPRPSSLARMRLFCFPIAGGNASAFQTFPDALSPDIEVCAVQFPGRQQRSSERPFTRMPLAVQELERAIHPYLDLPFAIFGTCTGSLAGYELAQRLNRLGEAQPIHFFGSCCRAPHLPDRDTPIHRLAEPELWAEVKRLGGTPEVVLEHPELKALLLPILRADFELAETYHYREAPPLECSLTVFGGSHDPIVSREELDAWSDHTTATSEVRILNGGHYLLDSAQEELLAGIADVCLNGYLRHA